MSKYNNKNSLFYIGDIVKVKEIYNYRYGVTNNKMIRAIIEEIKENKVLLRILEHENSFYHDRVYWVTIQDLELY